MCNAGKWACVFMERSVSLGIQANAQLLDINRNDAWKDRLHGCIVGTSEGTSSHPHRRVFFFPSMSYHFFVPTESNCTYFKFFTSGENAVIFKKTTNRSETLF